MLPALILLAALSGSPSLLDGEAQTGANGTALAWEMAEKLKTASVGEAYVLVRLKDLDNKELTRFLGAWRMTAPGIQASVRIRAEAERLLALIDQGPAQVRTAPQPKPLSPMQRLQPPAPLQSPTKPVPYGPNNLRPEGYGKSTTIGMLLSVVLGLGTGNIYAEAYGYGASMAAVQLLAIAVARTSRSYRNPAILTYLIARLADGIGTGVNIGSYNEAHPPGTTPEDLDLDNFVPVEAYLPLLSLTW